ncbi:MAG: helix-turn-helix transcriptional regulator [Clostridia bacterium]
MFAEKIKKYRIENKLTIQQMADKIGIPKRTYEEWEAQRHIPDKFK